MGVYFEREKLFELLHDFYTLTQIRLAIFDMDFNRIISYPETESDFCIEIKKCDDGKQKCMISDREACWACKMKNKLHIYQCHAGLIEAVSPLKMNDITIGYIMFGQIIDKTRERAGRNEIVDYASRYMHKETAQKLFGRLVAKDGKQIKAASKIMETCASYLWVSEIVRLEEDNLIYHLTHYISHNITDDLSVDKLCEKFCISRNRLYKISNNFYGMSIAKFIRKKRVELAMKYLKDGFTVAESAELSGFYDYNYFSKIFKRETNMLPSACMAKYKRI